MCWKKKFCEIEIKMYSVPARSILISSWWIEQKRLLPPSSHPPTHPPHPTKDSIFFDTQPDPVPFHNYPLRSESKTILTRWHLVLFTIPISVTYYGPLLFRYFGRLCYILYFLCFFLSIVFLYFSRLWSLPASQLASPVFLISYSLCSAAQMSLFQIHLKNSSN